MLLVDQLLSVQPFLAFIALSVFLVLVYVVQGLTSPLRHLPGPWHTKFTNLRLKWATISGQRMYYVHSLHQEYGPIVRLAPCEANVADATGFKQIYGNGSGFKKSDWYKVFAQMPRLTSFSETDERAHGIRRRLLSSPYSKSSLRQNWEPLVQEKVKTAMAQIRAEGSSGGPVDILKWFMLMTNDVITHLCFGECFHQIESGKTSEYMKALALYATGGAIKAEMPLLATILKRVPIPACRQLFGSVDIVQKFAQPAISNMRGTTTARNIFSKINDKLEGETASIDDLDVITEATTQIVGGSDTTANTLTFLVYAVLSFPALQQRLEDEVASLPEEYSDADLEKLIALNRVISEALRLYSAVPSALPRVVPAGGRKICSIFVPEGSVVSAQNYSLHRLPDVFPDPEKFNPSRWTEPYKVPTQEAQAAWNPFGGGPRVCLGQHLALMEMRMAVTELFRTCRGASLDASTTANSMEQVDYFLVKPKAHSCNIKLPV